MSVKRELKRAATKGFLFVSFILKGTVIKN